MKHTKVVFDNVKLQYSASLMRALAHPLRLKILEFIDRNDNTNVNKIYSTLKIEQSITSQHLRILKMAGVLSCRKEGKCMYYTINYDVIERVELAVSKYLSC